MRARKHSAAKAMICYRIPTILARNASFTVLFTRRTIRRIWSIIQLPDRMRSSSMGSESAITVQCSVDFYSHRQFTPPPPAMTKKTLPLRNLPPSPFPLSSLPSLQHEDTVRLMKGGDPACLLPSAWRARAPDNEKKPDGVGGAGYTRHDRRDGDRACAHVVGLIIWPLLRSTQKMHRRMRLYFSRRGTNRPSGSGSR